MPPVRKASEDKLLHCIVCTLLILMVLILFGQTGNFEFLNYDDNDYVSENIHVRAGLTASSLKWAFTSTMHEHWHPLTWISHMADCQLFGLDAGSHHLTNVVLHALSALVLFLFLRNATQRYWSSLAIAALFAIHPMNVQSVAWIAERKNVLSTLLAFITLYYYIEYAKNSSKTRYLLCFVFFCLGLLAKSMLVTLPILMLLLDFWPLGRLKLPTPDRKVIAFVKDGMRLILEKMPFFAASVVMAVIIIVIHDEGRPTFIHYSLADRLTGALISYIQYIGKLFWPSNMAVVYPHQDNFALWQIAGAIAILLSATASAIISIQRRPYILFGWIWFVFSLLPVVGIVQSGPHEIADRYVYIPYIGLFIIFIWGGVEVFKFKNKNIFPALVIAVTLVLSYVSWINISFWRNSTSLFEHAVSVTENNSIAYLNLGESLNEQNPKKALQYFNRAYEIDKGNSNITYNIGRAYSQLRNYESALKFYNETIKIDPKYVKAYVNIGATYILLNNLTGAEEFLRKAIEVVPRFYMSYYNLGRLYEKQGKISEAKNNFERALQLNPNDANSRDALQNLQ